MFVSNLDPNRGATRSGTGREDLPQENSLRTGFEAMLAVEQARNFMTLLPLRRFKNTTGNDSAWALGVNIHFLELEEMFCQAPHSKTADDVIFWADFAMTFVEASLACELSRLRRFPPNPIGLSVFLAGRGGGTENIFRESNVSLIRMFRGKF